MAFFEQQFPTRISANATGGPRFMNSKAYTQSGQRITNRDAVYPLHQYTIAHPIRTNADFEELRAFFYVVGGDADGFRFKDWSDYRATQTNTSLSLISTGVYQLNRLYTFGNRTFIRPVYKPVNNNLRVFRTRSGVTTDITIGSVSIDYTNGRATITDHVAGDTYTWSGEFDVPAAFIDPQAMWQLVGTGLMLTEWPNIQIEEIRL
jgi:uncharacterized protein (TIGR02217 family)